MLSKYTFLLVIFRLCQSKPFSNVIEIQYAIKFPNKVFTLHNIYTLEVICCCSHQLTRYCYYVHYYIVYMYISILFKSLCIYLIEHSSYCAAISCSVMLLFREREPHKHNKQGFNNAQHSFNLIQCIIADLLMSHFSARNSLRVKQKA